MEPDVAVQHCRRRPLCRRPQHRGVRTAHLESAEDAQALLNSSPKGVPMLPRFYREYDRQGQQTIEMPVVNDEPNGEGWILENGIRARKKFTRDSVLEIR